MTYLPISLITERNQTMCYRVCEFIMYDFRFKVTSGAIVCIADNSADIERFSGDVVIGTGSVLHPRVYISANGGTVDIGEGNIIEEQVRITNR